MAKKTKAKLLEEIDAALMRLIALGIVDESDRSMVLRSMQSGVYEAAHVPQITDSPLLTGTINQYVDDNYEQLERPSSLVTGGCDREDVVGSVNNFLQYGDPHGFPYGIQDVDSYARIIKCADLAGYVTDALHRMRALVKDKQIVMNHNDTSFTLRPRAVTVKEMGAVLDHLNELITDATAPDVTEDDPHRAVSQDLHDALDGMIIHYGADAVRRALIDTNLNIDMGDVDIDD